MTQPRRTKLCVRTQNASIAAQVKRGWPGQPFRNTKVEGSEHGEEQDQAENRDLPSPEVRDAVSGRDRFTRGRDRHCRRVEGRSSDPRLKENPEGPH